MNPPRRELIAACLVVCISLIASYICGCAGLLFEGAEAGEAAAGALAAETAPAVGEAALESSAFDELWARGVMPTFDLSLEEDLVTPQIGRTRFSIDLASGAVRSEGGVPVAQIEGSRIYRVYPQGTHELVARIETRLARPVTAYSDPAVLNRVRVLRTGEIVRVVRVEKGWYQLRYLDNNTDEVLLWVFAPALISQIQREDNRSQGPQSISFRTRVSKRELIASTLESAEAVKADIHRVLPQK